LLTRCEFGKIVIATGISSCGNGSIANTIDNAICTATSEGNAYTCYTNFSRILNAVVVNIVEYEVS